MKILDLFNEYNLSPEMTGGEMEQPRTEKDWNTMSRIYKAYIVSKDFGWIKWLVENDKIDTSKANDKNLNGYEIELRIRAVKELVADSEEKTVLYLNLLMLLAIQDSPLELLISILK